MSAAQGAAVHREAVVTSSLPFADDHTGPKQVFEAVVDAIRPATPPPVASSRTFPPHSDLEPDQSALLFRPPVPASTPTLDISPTAALASRLPEQLPVPTQNHIPYRFPLVPSAEASSSRPHTPPKFAPFQGLRRGSLAPVTAARVETRRGSDPSNMELARLTSSGAGSSSSRGTAEMSSVSVRAGVLKQKTRGDDRGLNGAPEDRAKDDMAMAKWRKWIIEHPEPGSMDASPTRSRKNSPAEANIPMVPLAPAFAPSRSPSGQTRISSSRTDSDGSGPRVGRIDHAKLDHLTTETMRALQDVELAVDETVLSKTGRALSHPRRMSSNPRVSQIENPFIDISSRLGSRRVRPLVIELIHGLGHYVDAVWSLRYPGKPCPWVMGPNTPPERRKSIIPEQAAARVWRSRMITAVQAGKAEGFVSPPTMADLKFWEEEVKYSLRDVDDVVGIYKGVAWAFSTALVAGQYGEVQSSNVVGADEEGGNIARLLNDLEEAMWGDAPPRPTDLAYELPEDFDPFAVPSADELLAGGATGGPSLSAFFSDGVGARTSSSAQSPAQVYDNDALPALLGHGAEHSENSAIPVSPAASRLSTPSAQPVNDPLGLEAYKAEGGEMTLEEVGRKRHAEWLASRAEVPW